MKTFSLIFFIALIAVSIQDDRLNVGGNSYGIYYTAKFPQIQDNGNTLIMQGNNRISLLQSQNTQTPSKDDFAYFNLVGKTISYQIDLSQAGCGCNVALYMVDTHILQQGQYYCDGNQGAGIWCPEMDNMEANTHGFHVTPHCCCTSSCNGNPGQQCLTQSSGQYNVCDQWGYSGGFGGSHAEGFDHQDAYGPGKMIDTNKPFQVLQSFITSSGNLQQIQTTLRQDSNQIQLKQQSLQDYLSRMGVPLQEGMAIVISLWSGGMSWLDGGEGGCTQDNCDINNVSVKISNIQISNNVEHHHQK